MGGIASSPERRMAKETYTTKGYVKAAIVNALGNVFSLFRTSKRFANGGEIKVMRGVDKKKTDYKAILTIARSFAEEGDKVEILAPVHAKSKAYEAVYGSLKGTKFKNKCPDLRINGKFYEFEGYERPWNKRKISNMLSHGFAQSDRVIIDNGGGASDRFIKKAINARRGLPNAQIKEVWIYEKGKKRLFFKDGRYV